MTLPGAAPDLTTNYDLSGSPGSLPFENIVPASVCASITAVDVHGDPWTGHTRRQLRPRRGRTLSLGRQRRCRVLLMDPEQ